MIKIERFYSAWNGLTSDTPYLPIPTDKDIQDAKNTPDGKLEKGDYNIFYCTQSDAEKKHYIACGLPVSDLIEVKTSHKNGLSTNRYRDLYRVTIE